jgi:hypothetical protein
MNYFNVVSQSASLRSRARRWLGLGVLVLSMAGNAYAAEGSFKHEFLMRGQIIAAEAGSLVVCIGETDGAEVGQELAVISHQRVTGTPKKAGPRFRRETVGRVRITSMFDDHYAMAEIVDGEASLHDTVELIR